MDNILSNFLLSIHIDQEAILRFFSLTDPNTFEKSELFDALAPVSTSVSMYTLKVVIKGLLERYETGLGLLDLENIIFFLTFIRFLLLAFKYNIKTSFYICSISFIAAVLWYNHIKGLRRFYGPLMVHNRLAYKMLADMRYEDYVRSGTRRLSYENIHFINYGMLPFFRNAILHAVTRNHYMIDPVSMMVANMSDTFKYREFVIEWYYKLYTFYIPKIVWFFTNLFRQIAPILLYSNVTRVNKKYCPYFIRWHWTFMMISGVVEGEVARVLYRLYGYVNGILIPTGRYDEATFFRAIFTVFVGILFLSHYLALLHAVCGQYFYVPFLVENTEIHIGNRPKNSIYSGGYASWQEGREKGLEMMTKGNKKFIFPRIWWGWLGNKKSLKNINEREYQRKRKKSFRRKRNKRFRKILRKLKNWITRN